MHGDSPFSLVQFLRTFFVHIYTHIFKRSLDVRIAYFYSPYFYLTKGISVIHHARLWWMRVSLTLTRARGSSYRIILLAKNPFRWKIIIAIIPYLDIRLLQNSAHATTDMLSWPVQNLMITLLGFGCEKNRYFDDFDLRCESICETRSGLSSIAWIRCRHRRAPANEVCLYKVTPSLIGWAQTYDQPWINGAYRTI